MLNHIDLMGRLTKEPELRQTQNGAVANFTIANDRDFANKNEKQTDFIDVVAWKKTAEFAAKYFHKGQLIALSGRLQIRDWKDKDGNPRRSAEVVANNVYFTDSKKGQDTKFEEIDGDEGGELPW